MENVDDMTGPDSHDLPNLTAYVMDKATGKRIGRVITDGRASGEELARLLGLRPCIVDTATDERGYIDDDGDKHYIADLCIVYGRD